MALKSSVKRQLAAKLLISATYFWNLLAGLTGPSIGIFNARANGKLQIGNAQSNSIAL